MKKSSEELAKNKEIQDKKEGKIIEQTLFQKIAKLSLKKKIIEGALYDK